MSFEKQRCSRCHTFTMCYLHNLDEWYCDPCFGWIIADAKKKDEVREIFCGIEDLEPKI